METTQELLMICRDEIVRARKRLATDRSLLDAPRSPARIVALIDGRKWFIDMVACDFESELAIVEMSLDEELARL